MRSGSPSPSILLTQDDLDALLEHWVRELRIGDWEISMRIARGRELRNKDTPQALPRHGDCSLSEKKQMALIRILDPADYDVRQQTAFDMEVTLVHELLHVQLAAFTSPVPNDHRDICQEKAIHKLSLLLVRMRRHNHKRKAT